MSDTGKRKRLILVVEDDEEQLTLMRMLLADADFDVVTESNADRVIQSVRDLRPDVVLMDVMLPSTQGNDGFELCRQIKSDPQLSTIKVIMVSAIAQGTGSQSEKLREQLGADDFIVKPYEPGSLVDRINSVISG